MGTVLGTLGTLAVVSEAQKFGKRSNLQNASQVLQLFPESFAWSQAVAMPQCNYVIKDGGHEDRT